MNQPLRFGPYRLDPRRGLWRGQEEVRLAPKALALLSVLVERAPDIVSKDEMLRAVWPGTAVSDAALTSCVLELRQALQDDARAPRYIETRHRRGYRFIARPSVAPAHAGSGDGRSTKRRWGAEVVGRDRELYQLRRWFGQVRGRHRQIVFVTGEAGIGKTTVVEAFLARAAAAGSVRVGRGQCVEHYGAGEAYLPVLDALARLGRDAGGDRLVQALTTCAPTWLAQLPFLIEPGEQEALQRRTHGTTRQRMLRELTDALDAFALHGPVVLWLEDLHWSDVSTLDWLAFLGRRPEGVQLMVIATYRPEAVLARRHPLEAVKTELQLHRLCRELPVDRLAESDVERYVTRRLSRRHRPTTDASALAGLIHARSEGNPLFMVNILNDLIGRGGDQRGGPSLDTTTLEVPPDVRSMIVQHYRRLDEADRRVLEVASVTGAEFAVPAVAAGAQLGPTDVEACCAVLTGRQQFLRARGSGVWPDGTVAPRYGFLHALYREVLYEQVPAGHRATLHQRIGACLEAGWGERSTEIAAELAMHFERAGAAATAVHHLEQAGRNAIRRNAPKEAIAHLIRAIDLLASLGDAGRARHELALQTALGSQLMAIRGWGAPEVERAYGRAYTLARQVADAPQLFSALWGLWLYYWGRGDLGRARAAGQELLALAEGAGDRALLLQAHHALWPTLFCQGAFREARDHAFRGIDLYEPEAHGALAPLYGNHDAGACGRWFGARALAVLGLPDALDMSRASIALAERLGHPFSQALALSQAAALHQCLGDPVAVRERAEAAIALARAHDFRLPLIEGTALLGWSYAKTGRPQEGIALIRDGIDAAQAGGSEVFRPYYLALLAEAYGMAGQAAEGLDALAEGLATAARTGARFCDAELYRIQGELLGLGSQDGGGTQTSEARSPRACLMKAIDIAREQGASAFEARAASSLRSPGAPAGAVSSPAGPARRAGRRRPG